MTVFTKMAALAVTCLALAAPIAQASHTAPLTSAQVARLGAATEAAGFKRIDRYLKQRYAEQTARAGAATEAAGFKGIEQYLKQHYGPRS